jgi:hypothetical protein
MAKKRSIAAKPDEPKSAHALLARQHIKALEVKQPPVRALESARRFWKAVERLGAARPECSRLLGLLERHATLALTGRVTSQGHRDFLNAFIRDKQGRGGGGAPTPPASPDDAHERIGRCIIESGVTLPFGPDADERSHHPPRASPDAL